MFRCATAFVFQLRDFEFTGVEYWMALSDDLPIVSGFTIRASATVAVNRFRKMLLATPHYTPATCSYPRVAIFVADS